LFTDLIQMCQGSSSQVLRQLFSKGNPEEIIPQKGGKKRPVTAGFQFKKSMQTLLTALYACQPHYIRCIKPNDEKKPLYYNDTKVQEQSKYLGLLENLRVRRAGYCYRQTYAKWLSRYYMVSTKTFPKWRGDEREGVQIIIGEMKLPEGEVQFGKTKVFLRRPKTLYEVEALRLVALHRIATRIQSVWRAWRIRKIYLELKKEALDIFKGMKERTRQSMARGVVSFFGDFLGMKDNKEILGIIQPTGDTKVIFSELVKKVNLRNKIQERVLLMTDKAIYNLERFPKPKKGLNFSFKRRIDLNSISHISLSKYADNFFIIHIPTEYDYVYESPKKTILLTLLNQEFKRVKGSPLDVKVLDSLQYTLKKKKGTKVITFAKDEQAHQAVVKPVKGNLTVKIASGVTQ